MGDAGLFCGFVVIFGLFSVCCAQSFDTCFTPRNQNGECKVITECHSIFALLERRPIESQDADYLQRSKCGLEGTIPKVCCPIEIQPPTISKPIFTNSDAHPVDSPLLPSTDVCGIDTQDKIYGGKIAGLREFPWMCLVEYERVDKKRGFFCGGVLINSRYILTAAHCIKGRNIPKSWKIVSVRLGEFNTENETDCIFNGYKQVCAPAPVNVPVEETIAHEHYNAYDTNQYHDVALLRLAKNVNFTGYVKPVCLPTTSFDQSKTFAGERLMVAGWGKTENRTESSVKLKLWVPVVNNSECSRIFTKTGINVHGAQLCAGGEKNKDSCKGDSGGPLMSNYAIAKGDINWYSVGIVSTGPSPCGKEGWPAVYARVANYLPWIVSKLRP